MAFSSDNNPKKKKLNPADALIKIRNYCAYQERAHKEVKQKLYDYGLRSDEVDEIISRLNTEGFLNEERFAKAFAGGKFRMKKWGRIKIQNELEMLGLTNRCIGRGLKEIDERDYRQTLKELLKKKVNTLEEKNPYKRKDKLARYAISKGYEADLVWSLVKELFE